MKVKQHKILKCFFQIKNLIISVLQKFQRNIADKQEQFVNLNYENFGITPVISYLLTPATSSEDRIMITLVNFFLKGP